MNGLPFTCCAKTCMLCHICKGVNGASGLVYTLSSPLKRDFSLDCFLEGMWQTVSTHYVTSLPLVLTPLKYQTTVPKLRALLAIEAQPHSLTWVMFCGWYCPSNMTGNNFLLHMCIPPIWLLLQLGGGGCGWEAVKTGLNHLFLLSSYPQGLRVLSIGWTGDQ